MIIHFLLAHEYSKGDERLSSPQIAAELTFTFLYIFKRDNIYLKPKCVHLKQVYISETKNGILINLLTKNILI